MQLGSHNTFTYLPPRKWWLIFGSPIYKCQTKPFEKQLSLGIDIIDIRVRFDKQGNVLLCHGYYEAKFPKMEEDKFADYILSKIGLSKKMTIRLILETFKPSLYQETLFIRLCKAFVDKSSTNITLIGGHRKFDWGKVYKLSDDDEMYLVQLVSSMASNAKWYEKWFPFLYAKRYNKKNLEIWKYSSAHILFDFL